MQNLGVWTMNNLFVATISNNLNRKKQLSKSPNDLLLICIKSLELQCFVLLNNSTLALQQSQSLFSLPALTLSASVSHYYVIA